MNVKLQHSAGHKRALVGLLAGLAVALCGFAPSAAALAPVGDTLAPRLILGQAGKKKPAGKAAKGKKNEVKIDKSIKPRGKPNLWGMPESASTTTKYVDPAYWIITVICLIFFVGLVAIMVVFVVKYRYRGEEVVKTSPISHNTKLEVAWSVIPAVILVFIFFVGFRGWMGLNVPPRDSLEVRVYAEKWAWKYRYPNHTVPNDELVVPVNRNVKLLMYSSDVLHSFYVPAFRIKKDVLPGRYTVVWFKATKTGVFDVRCAEYCGTRHSKMISRVRVLPHKVWKRWYDAGGFLGSPAELGAHLFKVNCSSCHTADKSRKIVIGPALYGIYGKTETMSDGSKVKVDDNYLLESIRSPQAKILKGFESQNMNPFPEAALSQEHAEAIIEYIKSLGRKNKGQPPKKKK